MESAIMPEAFSLALSKISGVSTNSFRVNPIVGAGNVTAGQQIRILLPTAGFLHLPSTKLYFSVTTTVNGTRLPQYTSSLFSRIQVMCGGVTLTAGNSVHGVVECVKNIVHDDAKCLASEHPEMVLAVDYQGTQFDSTASGSLNGQATAAPETYAAGLAANAPIFSVDLGDFFQSCKPEYIDLALTGQIEVVLTAAENSVLSSIKGTGLPGKGNSATSFTEAGAGGGTFTLVNPVAVCNMVSLLDGAYPMALRQAILDDSFIQYSFHEHIAFQQAFNGNTRFNLAAMSLNKLHTVFRRNDALTQAGGIPIAGQCATSKVGQENPAGYNWTGNGILVNAGPARLQGRFQQFSLPATAPAQSTANLLSGVSQDYGATAVGTNGACELQYRINSTQVPNLFLSPQQVVEVAKYSNDLKSFKEIKSLTEYLYNKFVLSYRFDLASKSYDRTTISGLDSRNSNSMIEVVSNGGNVDLSNFDSIVIADVTKLVRVGEGKQLETIS